MKTSAMLRHRAIARRLAGVDPHHYLADVVPRLTGLVAALQEHGSQPMSAPAG